MTPPDAQPSDRSHLVRPEAPGDVQAVAALVEAAFGADEGPVVARLVERLRGSGRSCASLVAERAGEVVGHVMLTRGWLDAPDAVEPVLVLSPLSVAPAHQRTGLGRALSDAAVRWAKDAGESAVFLEGDPRYYARLGWRPGGELGCTAPSPRIPPAAFQAWPLPRWRPELAGPLAYCDVFWELDCVGLR